MAERKTTRVDVRFYGERNFPVATATIPDSMIHDFEALLAEAQGTHPMYNHEFLMRYIWVRGLDAFRYALQQKKVPDPLKTPTPRTPGR